MPHENPLAGSPEDWLRYAASDLELARIPLPNGVLLEGLCFHAQQAAEKALKALLVFHSIPVPRTHHIGMLVDLLPDRLVVPDSVEKSVVLTDYSVMARYPGDFESVTEEEYRNAIFLAEEVVSWARRILVENLKT